MHLRPCQPRRLPRCNGRSTVVQLYSHQSNHTSTRSLGSRLIQTQDERNNNKSSNTHNGHKALRTKTTSFLERFPGWNLVVGIEVHAQLKTRKKLFSKTSLSDETGLETNANERVSLFDAAFPGTLPKINPVCVALATRTALALRADIQPRSTFDRKHYFYGDLPAGYQITQNYAPFARNGHLTLSSNGKLIRIKQIQIEQDTAKSVTNNLETVYDLNRAGTPLLEIVTLPDIESAEEAGEYVRSLQALLRGIAVGDGMMEAGSLRCDVNVSVHRDGAGNGVRTEIKNLNSVKSVVQAINAEATRQINLLVSNTSKQHPITQQTLTFDEDTLLTRPLRTKEGVEDYRYMPDPNLPPLIVNNDYINGVERSMSVLGMENDGAVGWEAVKLRLKKRLRLDELSKSDGNAASDFISIEAIERDLSILMQLDAGKNVGWDGEVVPGAITFFEDVLNVGPREGRLALKRLNDAESVSSVHDLKGAKHMEQTDGVESNRDPRLVLNWIIHELLGQLSFRGETFAQNPMTPLQLAQIIDAVSTGVITSTAGKTLLRFILDAQRPSPSTSPPSNSSPSSFSSTNGSGTGIYDLQLFSIPTLITNMGLAKSSSISQLGIWCQQAIEEMPEEARKVKAGKKAVIMRLVGKVMSISKGAADPVEARKWLEKQLQ